MSNIDDITGNKYNYLTVLYATGRIEGKRGFFWHCKCDCGNEIDVLGASLKSGNTTACGCRQKIGWKNGYKHGLTHTRLHSIWNGMKQRCFSKNNDYYYNYGGRGITMCDEWKNDFKAFYNWSIKNGYSDNLTIDRIDNDGNYEPSNCRWITRTEQMRNTRRSRKFSYKGEMKTASELSEICGIPSVIIYHRIAILNWNIEDAMSKPVKKYKRSS